MNQQKDLEPLIPTMSESERLELLKLIERANRELGHGHSAHRHSKRHSHRLLILGLVALAIIVGLATLGLSFIG